MTSVQRLVYWVIPPQADAEFVAQMEEVLDVYQRFYDANRPVLCMDEQPFQLTKETRRGIRPTREQPIERVDYEYERAGTASGFMFSEPLAGWRAVSARKRRTKIDWAEELAALLDGRYAHCERITLVCNNLNTHTKGALYEAFAPERARRYVRRIEWCHTPKHGSGLNVAECERSAMTRQCIKGRRIGKIKKLRQQLRKWAGNINAKQRGVDWQRKVNDARIKLKNVYPKILA